MDLDTFIGVLCLIPAAIYFLVYGINWQWVGFNKFKKEGHK